jgi:hypothetical protein
VAQLTGLELDIYKDSFKLDQLLQPQMLAHRYRFS